MKTINSILLTRNYLAYYSIYLNFLNNTIMRVGDVYTPEVLVSIFDYTTNYCHHFIMIWRLNTWQGSMIANGY